MRTLLMNVIPLILQYIQGAMLFWMISCLVPTRWFDKTKTICLAAGVQTIYRFISWFIVRPQNMLWTRETGMLVRALILAGTIVLLFKCKRTRDYVGVCLFTQLMEGIRVLIGFLFDVAWIRNTGILPLSEAQLQSGEYLVSGAFKNMMAMGFIAFFVVLIKQNKGKKGLMDIWPFLVAVLLQYLMFTIFSFRGMDYTYIMIIEESCLAFGGLLLDVLVYLKITRSREKRQAEEVLRTTVMEQEERLALCRMQEKYLEISRKRKHDYANQLQVLYTMLEEESDEETLRVLAECRASVAEAQEVIK